MPNRPSSDEPVCGSWPWGWVLRFPAGAGRASLSAPRMSLRTLRTLLLAALGVAAVSAGPDPAGRVRITYWEKWTGGEGRAMQRVVDQFNASQDRIWVDFLTVAQIDRKTIVATAGGDPPDVAGVWGPTIGVLADNHGLLPLDDFIRAEGGEPAQFLERYQPGYRQICLHEGTVYGLITASSTIALHWNKTLFREAGLDPERPPRTVEELDAMARTLTRRNPTTGRLTQMGFLPQEPGWWPWMFPVWFGGSLYEGGEVTLGRHPANLKAFEWVADYTRAYGADEVKAFATGFGGFASPQAAFFSGKVAMVFQGSWLHTYIQQYAPGLDYGVAPLPDASPDRPGFTPVEADVVVIPRGTKHPREAWEFLKFLSTSNPRAERLEELRGIELLGFLQERPTALREWSPYFVRHHRHPYLQVFRRQADSPHAMRTPETGMWQEYLREINWVFEKTRLLEAAPAVALARAQERAALSLRRHTEVMKRFGRAELPEVVP